MTYLLQFSNAIKRITPGLNFATGLFFCTLISLSSFAQLSQPHRYEKIQKSTSNAFNIISMKEQGLALVHEKDESKEYKKLWEVILLDSTLKETASLETSHGEASGSRSGAYRHSSS